MQDTYSTIRLKASTLSQLRRLREVYESTTGRRLSMDGFFEILTDASRRADPDIWEIFQLKTQLEEQISRKIRESRDRRNLTVDAAGE